MNIEGKLLAVVLANIFFLSTGLAGVSFGYASEVCAVLLVLVLLMGARCFAHRLISFLRKGNNVITLALAIYLVADAINFWVMGDHALAWQKYRVAAVLLLLFTSLCILCSKSGLSSLVMLAVGCAAVVVSIYTLAQYFLPLKLPLFYTSRFSLRSDYNMYATLLLIGLISLVFGVLQFESKMAVLVSLVPLPTIISLILLSGSRRVLIFLPVVLMVLTIVLIVASSLPLRAKKMRVIIVCVFLVVMLTSAETFFLRQKLELINKTQGETRSIMQSSIAETQLVERYETIHSSSLFKKRKVIWGLAVQELSKFSRKEMIFGRGDRKSVV